MAENPDSTSDPAVLDVAVLLRAARHHADLSQRELAAVAGVSRGLVGDLESGLKTAAPVVPGRALVGRGRLPAGGGRQQG